MTDLDSVGYDFSPAQRDMLLTALNSGYSHWSGVRLLEARAGYARLAFRPRAEMLTPWGTLNGGVINSLVEVPGFVALLTGLAPGELPVTNDIFLQHIRPLPGDVEYELEGRVLRRGKTMAWVETTALVAGKPHSLARITKTIISKDI